MISNRQYRKYEEYGGTIHPEELFFAKKNISEDAALDMLREDPYNFFLLPKRYWKDKDFFIKALKEISVVILRFADISLCSDKNIIDEFSKSNTLSYLGATYKVRCEDYDFAVKHCKLNPHNVRGVPKVFQTDEIEKIVVDRTIEVYTDMIAKLNQEGKSIEKSELFKTRYFAEYGPHHTPAYISRKYANILLMQMKLTEECLMRLASGEMARDPKFMLTAVRLNPKSLKGAHFSLWHNKEFLAECLKYNNRLIDKYYDFYIREEFKDMYIPALQKDGSCFGSFYRPYNCREDLALLCFPTAPSEVYGNLGDNLKNNISFLNKLLSLLDLNDDTQYDIYGKIQNRLLRLEQGKKYQNKINTSEQNITLKKIAEQEITK